MRLYRPTPWLLVCTLALLVACQPKTVPMTPEEAQRVAQFTERMTTRCVGRYLVDLPATFVLNSQWAAEVEGVKVEVQPMNRPRFDTVLERRKLQIESEKFPMPYLTGIRRIPSAEGAIFNRAEGGSSASSRVWELFGWRDGFLLILTVGARDESLSTWHLPELSTNLEERLAHLLSVFERTRGRVESEIPKDQGFCIANGFVAGPPSEQEEAYVSFHLDGAPDVYFDVGANPEKLKEKERLLERGSQVEREMTSSGTQTIRKGMVEHGGIPFDEWLFKGPTPDRVPGTMFTLVGNEASPGVSHPFIRLELFNGFRIPAPERSMEESAQLKTLQRATLSEAEALAIWDKVTPTLRLRPGAI